MAKPIDEVLRVYCDNFLRTGELDQALLAQLEAFAAAHRKPRTDGRRSRARNSGGQILAGPEKPPPIGGLHRGRPVGCRFLIVNGKRKLLRPEEIDNAIQNGACYPFSISSQSAAEDRGARQPREPDSAGSDDGGAHSHSNDVEA